ncbi:MAG: diguanylate cyclase [Spirochaetales bacterium]|nr:diguanylate cyclase [Spirochaetales bacterium]
MSNLSESIKLKLASMAEDYLRQLPLRFNEILKNVSIARTEGDLKSLGILKNSIHKLAGSGATFGFDELSLKSKELEESINLFLEDENKNSSFDWKEFDESLLVIQDICKPDSAPEELEELEELDSSIAPLVLNLQADRFERNLIVYLSDKEDSVISEITEQMGIFGFRITPIYDIDTLETFFTDNMCRVLIVNTSFIEKDSSAGSRLTELKRISRYSLSIIYVADSGDFNLRLKTVKSGGDAFFVVPLDTGILVDKIDKLTSRINHPPYHILLIDDDPEQIVYYAFVLQQAGMITSVASDPKQVIEVLVESKPELIIMDMYMPTCDGIELASIIRQHESFLTIPIIFLSAEKSEGKHLDAIRTGADDFLIKPIKPETLITIINAKAVRNRNLRYLMERDSLTGLLNHANLKERISMEMIRVKRSGGNLSYAMIDADHFKNVNDTYGHLAGDLVLKSLSRMLQDRLRRTDIIGRYGGEEFGIILINTDSDNAYTVMEEVRKNFGLLKHKSENEEFYVTLSCGIASFPKCNSPSELNDAADKAMYEAKSSGRDRTVVHGC